LQMRDRAPAGYMSKLRISPKLALPPDVVTSTLVIYGGKGMGKTNFGSVLVEEMTKSSLRWAVLDPLGVWWGLRHSADGKGPGIECLIVGGLHGDLPLEPTAGAVVADLVAEEEGTNVVVDFSRKPSGQMWTMGEKVRFVTDYALRLFQRQGEITGGRRRAPLMQILDESARYIPQIVPANQPELARSVGAWEQLTEEGRNVGLGVCFLTQRSARMNKSVSELADAMISFRIVGPRSIEAVTDWLGAHVERERQKAIVEQVRKLPVGQALVISPGWLDVEAVVPIRMRETFDSSATPKPGERRREPGQAAKPDLEKYKVRMAETIERAKAEDPKELRRQIADLKKELDRTGKMVVHSLHQPTKKGKQAPEHHPQDLKLIAALRQGLEDLMKVVIQINAQDFIAKAGEAVDKEALERAIAGAAEQAVKLVDRALANRGSQLEQLRRESQRVVARLKRLVEVDDVEVTVNVRHNEPFTVTPAPRPARAARPAAQQRAPDPPADSSFQPNAAQQRILNSLGWLEEIGKGEASRTQLALLSEMKPTGGYYNNMVGALRTAGMLTYPTGGSVRLTDAGRALAQVDEVPQTSEEFQKQVLGMVNALQKKILAHLIEHYPDPVTREDLAEAVGASADGGYFNNMVGALRTLGVIDYPGQGMVCAEPVLFLEEPALT
jgi:Mn-dependent DtxR family transcriptional regulator